MDDRLVYIPLRDGTLLALRRESGTFVWMQQLRTSLPPTMGEGTVFVATDRGIRAVEADTGAALWAVPTDAPVSAPLVWNGGWLFGCLENGAVLAFRAADGQLVWQRDLEAPSLHAAAAGPDNTVYLALSDSRVVALASADGVPIWERPLTGGLSQPLVAGNRVYVGSTDNFFYALDAESGDVAWKWRGGGDVIGAAADGDRVYFASLDNILRAVNRGSGNQRWIQETGTRPVLPPHAFGGIVVVTGLAPALTVYAGETGAVMATHLAAGNLIGPPLIDPELDPFRVALVTITREGVVEARRPERLMFRETAATPLPALPGRLLTREPLYASPSVGPGPYD